MPSEPRTLRWTKRHGDECYGCRNGDWRHYELSKASGDWRDPKWKVNPDTRTVAWLEDQGWDAGIVERRAGVRRFDLFGYADIVAQERWAFDGHELGGDFLFVQATTAAHVNARVAKVKAEPRAKRTLECEGLIWVVGWRRLKRGGDRMEATVREILLEDFD